ncbi:uncharacterized protein LOC122046134 [Zingiber officinale]|uniref:uncharacterized protein LOC122046134 n=1 Tax=Zingiber officinale TaxID=94328 RepID=UPI001C4BA0A2|nr:uncharacterized protein LOC122046134 [Zingiber officinale]
MASRSPDSGESERDRNRERERELGMASGSPDSGERERGGDGERERELAKTSRSPDSSECERGGDGEREKESAMTSSSSGMTPDYWNASYWDERYRNNYSSYDWYMEYPSLVSLFDLYLRRHHRILIIGCGNSGTAPFSPFLYFLPPGFNSFRDTIDRRTPFLILRIFAS